MNNAIKLTDVSKSFGDFKIENFNMEIPKGAIVGFIGENGAGKTTIIRLILDIINRDGGEIEIFGKDNIDFGSEVKQDIGVILDQSFFYEGMTSEDVEKVLKQIYVNWDSLKFDKMLTKFGIDRKKEIKALSKGMRMKLNIATALSHNPKLLILDEPMDGLDPVARNEVEDIFLEFIMNPDNTIFISSHITSDLEKFADYIGLLHKGKLVIYQSKDELLEEYGLLKCGLEDIGKIDKADIKGMRKSSFGYEIMVDKKEETARKYPNFVIDKMNVEEIMFFYERGENV